MLFKDLQYHCYKINVKLKNNKSEKRLQFSFTVCYKHGYKEVRMMKICSQCYIKKEFTEFYKQENGQFGLTSECKECRKLRVKLKRNADKEKARHKIYYHKIAKVRAKSPQKKAI